MGEPNRLNRSDMGEKERFSEYLIRKGVLSPKMIQQLQSEFLGEPNDSSNEQVDDKSKSVRRTKKRK